MHMYDEIQILYCLHEYCTGIVQGMYDAKDGPLSSERWMKTMHAWEGLARTCSPQGRSGGPRHRGRGRGRGGEGGPGEGRLAGYSRSWGPLTHIVVIGAGHQVPADQPENALEMIETWVEAQMVCRRQQQAAAARL